MGKKKKNRENRENEVEPDQVEFIPVSDAAKLLNYSERALLVEGGIAHKRGLRPIRRISGSRKQCFPAKHKEGMRKDVATLYDVIEPGQRPQLDRYIESTPQDMPKLNMKQYNDMEI